MTLLTLSACSEDAASPSPGADTETSPSTVAEPVTPPADPSSTTSPAGRAPAVNVARRAARSINNELPATARRYATRAVVRRMVDLHDQGFAFERPYRCRFTDGSWLCRSNLVVATGGGTSCNLRVRLLEGTWTVTQVQGLD